MDFSVAQYQATIDKINSGMQELSAKIGQVGPAANAAMDHWYIPGFVKDAIAWCAQKIIDLAKWIWDKFVELLKGAAAPVFMFQHALEWQDVKGMATGVQGVLRADQLSVDDHWKGAASDAYVAAIKPQSEAAGKIGTIADKTAQALIISAVASLAFYVALGVILIKFIAAMVVAIAAFGSAVFSWAGAALVVEEAGVNTALVTAAVTTLLAALGAQAQQLTVLKGELVDGSAFPGGHWPDATTGNYSDATVTDGDADWSFER
jgi:uncharacterized protein YukE